jgi:hypothetical protein
MYLNYSQNSAQLPKRLYITNCCFILDVPGAHHGIRQIESLPKFSNVKIFEFRAAHLKMHNMDVNKYWANFCPSVAAVRSHTELQIQTACTPSSLRPFVQTYVVNLIFNVTTSWHYCRGAPTRPDDCMIPSTYVPGEGMFRRVQQLHMISNVVLMLRKLGGPDHKDQ